MRKKMDRTKIKCPLCGNGIGKGVEIDGHKDDGSEFDAHCTKCNIWINLKEVTDKEKLEMFHW